ADDAALAVKHRLDFAVARDRGGFEAQVLHADGALDDLDGGRVERGEINPATADVIDGAEQRRAPLESGLIVGLAGQGEAGDDAEERRRDHEQGQRCNEARGPQPARRRPGNTGLRTHENDPPGLKRNPRMEPRAGGLTKVTSARTRRWRWSGTRRSRP